MKANNILCLCVYLCVISCVKPENKETLKCPKELFIHKNKVMLEYKKELKLFPSYMVDFFPDTLSGIYSTVENIDTTSQCIYYMNYNFESKNTFNWKNI